MASLVYKNGYGKRTRLSWNGAPAYVLYAWQRELEAEIEYNKARAAYCEAVRVWRKGEKELARLTEPKGQVTYE